MQPTSIQIPGHQLPRKPATAAEKKRSQLVLKEQLRDRLYDKGVSTGKMPSIQRPNSEHMRPCTAKLSSKLSKRPAEVMPGYMGLVQMISPSVPLSSYREIAPEFLVPEQELFPPAPEPRGKSLYTLTKDGPERPTTREGYPNIGIKRSFVAATVMKSITGVTVMWLPNTQVDCRLIGTITHIEGQKGRNGHQEAYKSTPHSEERLQCTSY